MGTFDEIHPALPLLVLAFYLLSLVLFLVGMRWQRRGKDGVLLVAQGEFVLSLWIILGALHQAKLLLGALAVAALAIVLHFLNMSRNKVVVRWTVLTMVIYFLWATAFALYFRFCT